MVSDRFRPVRGYQRRAGAATVRHQEIGIWSPHVMEFDSWHLVHSHLRHSREERERLPRSSLAAHGATESDRSKFSLENEVFKPIFFFGWEWTNRGKIPFWLVGKFRDFIAAVAGPMCHVFVCRHVRFPFCLGLLLRCLGRCVSRLLGGDVGKFHDFIAAVAVLLCVSCLVCVCVVYVFYPSTFGWRRGKFPRFHCGSCRFTYARATCDAGEPPCCHFHFLM